MKYIFDTKSRVCRVGDDINAPSKVLNRRGEMLIPFLSLTDIENQLYEHYGRLFQEKDRLSNLRWIEKDLEGLLRKWKQFYNHNALGNRYKKGEDKSSIGYLWEAFLDYSGKKGMYRLRKKKSNREVLEKQLKIKGDWNEDSQEIFPRIRAEQKLEKIKISIQKTRDIISEIEQQLPGMILELKNEQYEEDENTDQYRLDMTFDRIIREIQKKAKQALGMGIEKSPEEI